MMQMHRVYLSAGGNIGNTAVVFRKALLRLNQTAGRVLRVSGMYRTEPWGDTPGGPFLNLVLELETTLSPVHLLQALHQAEREAGRKRISGAGYQPRVLDLDILLYDDLVLHTPELTLPHPLMEQRRFVLQPLNELIPDYVHPVAGMTIRELLSKCSDPCKVEATEN